MQQDCLQKSRSTTGMKIIASRSFFCSRHFHIAVTICITLAEVSLWNTDDAGDLHFRHPASFSISCVHLEPQRRGILQPCNSGNPFQGHQGIMGSNEPWYMCCSEVAISALKDPGDMKHSSIMTFFVLKNCFFAIWPHLALCTNSFGEAFGRNTSRKEKKERESPSRNANKGSALIG